MSDMILAEGVPGLYARRKYISVIILQRTKVILVGKT